MITSPCRQNGDLAVAVAPVAQAARAARLPVGRIVPAALEDLLPEGHPTADRLEPTVVPLGVARLLEVPAVPAVVARRPNR